MLFAFTKNALAFAFLDIIRVSSGFPEYDLIVRFSLAIVIFSTYVPGFTIITSPGVALFTAVGIELFPGLTKISAAVPIPDSDNKIRKVRSKMVNFFILIPPYIQEKICERFFLQISFYKRLHSMKDEFAYENLCI